MCESGERRRSALASIVASGADSGAILRSETILSFERRFFTFYIKIEAIAYSKNVALIFEMTYIELSHIVFCTG